MSHGKVKPGANHNLKLRHPSCRTDDRGPGNGEALSGDVDDGFRLPRDYPDIVRLNSIFLLPTK